MRKQPKQLSDSDKLELDILENLEFRTSNLCNELRLNNDIHFSWSDMCSVLSPNNPSKIADKIFGYFNKLEMLNDKIYHEIYDSILNIGKDDVPFYHCDVVFINSIAAIIYENFKDTRVMVVEIIDEIHRKYGGSFDLDFLFREAVLTMRERCLISDELFSGAYEYKKCGNEFEDDMGYEEYYRDEDMLDEWDDKDRVLH
jgi:hypothetical protein